MSETKPDTDKPDTDKPVEGQLAIVDQSDQEGGPRVIAVEQPGPTRATDAIQPATDDPDKDDEDNEDAEGDTAGTDHEPEAVPPGDGDEHAPGEDKPADIAL